MLSGDFLSAMVVWKGEHCYQNLGRDVAFLLCSILQGCFTSACLLEGCVSLRHSQAFPYCTKAFSGVFCPGAVRIGKDVEARLEDLLE